MSNHISFDSLLVRALARELDSTLSGQRLHAVRLEYDAGALLLSADRFLLTWDLRPGHGYLRRQPRRRITGNPPLAAGTRVRSVETPPDERVIRFSLDGSEPTLTIVVELITNRWNVLVVGARDARVRALLRPSRKPTGVRPGALYELPRPTSRRGAETPVSREVWEEVLRGATGVDRERSVVREIAYLSSLNVGYVLGTEDAGAYERYRTLVDEHSWSALRIDRGRQPYPFPVQAGALPAPSLLDAFAAAAELVGEPGVETPTRAQERLARALRATLAARARSERRRGRLEQELARAAPRAAHLRREADLILAQLHRVGRGSRSAELEDFEGGTLRVEIDPRLSPADNANRRYALARKRERAADRLPALIAAEVDRAERLASLASRIEAGDRDAVKEAGALLRRKKKPAGKGQPATSLPYRTYRSTSGLEIRVGRGARSNDDLTFHHSSPEDIWMHARDVAGAHVVLRWPNRDANPSAAEITEAAVLAALHSRARTSGTVPVDWTRRKYVRKPRKAGPGRVIVERAQTVFVEPDPRVEQRLRPELPG